MGEDRDRDRVRGENNMSAQDEREAVGLSPDEVREINEPKPVQGDPLNSSRWKRRALNTAAAGTAAFLGGTFADRIHQAVNNPLVVSQAEPLPPRVSEVKPDPKRNIPPSTPGVKVTFPQDIRLAPVPDAPVGEVQYKHKVLMPRVLKDIQGQKLDEAERPLWPVEFGAPERGVTLFNRGIQKGVKIEDQQLFENLLYLREKYGRPDLTLRIYFYDSIAQLNNLSATNPYDLEHAGAPPYDFWATRQVPIFDEQGNFAGTKNYPATFKPYGVWRFKLGSDSTLEFHISLPELRGGGVLPAEEQIRSVSRNLASEDQFRMFMSNESGKRDTSSPLDPIDLRNYPTIGVGNSRSAFLIIMK